MQFRIMGLTLANHNRNNHCQLKKLSSFALACHPCLLLVSFPLRRPAVIRPVRPLGGLLLRFMFTDYLGLVGCRHDLTFLALPLLVLFFVCGPMGSVLPLIAAAFLGSSHASVLAPAICVTSTPADTYAIDTLLLHLFLTSFTSYLVGLLVLML